MFRWNKNKISKLPASRRAEVKKLRESMIAMVLEAGKQDNPEVLDFIANIGFDWNNDDYIDEQKFQAAFSDQVRSMITGGELLMLCGAEPND